MCLRRACLYTFLCLICTSVFSESNNVVRVQAQQDESLDASYQYFVGLLELALSKVTTPETRKTIMPAIYMPQARALRQVEMGKRIDIYWAGTSIDREQSLLPIKIPLLKGLLGFRVGIMHKDVEEGFRNIGSVKNFLKYRPCQGEGWPDTDILTAGGFDVVKNPSFEAMFKQVNIKRCHFFPRGIHEAGPEYMASREEFPDLRLNQELIIHYPFPMYFFVNKNNIELANLVTKGLEKAIDDGTFDKHMHDSQVTKHLFPVEKWIHAKFLELENPLLPKDANITDSRYWIQYKERDVELLR